MVGADGALCVGIHGVEAGVPEEPDVFVGGDGGRVEEGMVDVSVGAEVEEVGWDGVEACWDWKGL